MFRGVVGCGVVALAFSLVALPVAFIAGVDPLSVVPLCVGLLVLCVGVEPLLAYEGVVALAV